MDKCVLTFVDILGFANSVKALAANPSDAAFNRVKTKVRMFVSNLAADADPDRVGIQSFSDCVVRSRKVRAHETEAKVLGEEIKRLALCQRLCVSDNFVVRGGITIGMHFQGTLQARGYGPAKCMISPAMIEAYRMETTLAKYPRIIVKGDVVRNCGLQTSPLLAFDKRTDLYYIDYLWDSYVENAEEDDPFFQEHFDFIDNAVYAPDSEIEKKYKWLMRYHNRTLKRVFAAEWNGNTAWRDQGTRRQYMQQMNENAPLF